MKVLLGAAIVLLVFVTLGLGIYAYTQHRDVAYLTLRADYLEDRIAKLESGSTVVINKVVELEPRVAELDDQGVPTENQHGDADASTTTEVITLSDDESDASDPNLTLEEINRWRAQYGLPPRTLEEVNRQRAQYGQPLLQETPDLAEPDSMLNDFIANRIEREEAHRQVAPPPTPGPVVYTYRELYESREEGPDRPECEVVRQHAALTLPGWAHTNFLGAFGCATVEDRLRELERER
jgi:hypothetical protein